MKWETPAPYTQDPWLREGTLKENTPGLQALEWRVGGGLACLQTHQVKISCLQKHRPSTTVKEKLSWRKEFISRTYDVTARIRYGWKPLSTETHFIYYQNTNRSLQPATFLPVINAPKWSRQASVQVWSDEGQKSQRMLEFHRFFITYKFCNFESQNLLKYDILQN